MRDPAPPPPIQAPPVEIDLTNCDREPIHLLGAIQPNGFLIATSSEWQIRRVSANVEEFLEEPPEALLGRPLSEVFSWEALHEIGGRLHMLRGPDALERLFGVALRDGGAPYDLAVHMVDEQIVIEAEPSDLEDGLEASTTVRSMIARLQQADGMEGLCREAVRQIRGLTGFARVMLYRFHHDGGGEVVAESAASFLEAFMGLRFPASDIPKQARQLYERNWLRLISDADAAPVPILPARDADGQVLDLSLSVLRSVSPIHIEYLKNMGVAASMSISVLRKGKLWGLIACHNPEPLRIPFERRTAAELFSQIFSLQLESREREIELAREAAANKVHNRLMASLGAMRPGSRSLTDFLDILSEVLPCDGIGLWSASGTALHGHTPTAEEFAALIGFLNRSASGTIFSTHHLGKLHEPARDYADRAAGLLALPLSRAPRDYLVFFRRQVAHAVTWAGNPNKPVSLGPNGIRLTPRKSFAAWRETVEGRSEAWTESDLQMAERLRISLLEVVLQLSDMAEQERRVAQERQEILIAELNHRVRNILSLIRGLVKQSQGNAATVEEFAKLVGGRIQALARAHDQITADKWQPAPLADLVMAEAAAYLEHKADRVLLSGPPVLLDPQAHTTMALVIHEMMTNAAKYGALCDRHGLVRITWQRLPEGALEILWTEEGGPPVQPPSRKGFGTTIIERAVPHDLKGEAELRYTLGGMQGRFVLPAAYVHDAVPRPAEESPQPLREVEEENVSLALNIMLVEDNLLIAMDAEDQLRRLGAASVEVASNVQAALQIISRSPPDIALLDMNLGRENSFPVADALTARGIPFVFATGYGEASAFPERFRDAAVIKKPYTQNDIRAALLRRLA
ncbi:HWE histidine kinase domain-containing protein [Roseomonas marmotae]|uniref:histidine kinase n=1 Tax=Roseomonas marmotae TaxID=2768161 RepID=A0ABS3KA01_9PROT|nr:HWE histidine kinase domain-containing protein [Roseomonas marmotae]MBO1073161.1 GAF domain-containing protein [Roseomonas marmotae]QTI79204.1 GAF domain-containing protein [Roseomonas marmotae]